MRVETLPVREYVDLIEAWTPFAQANYGDGEWGCILGHKGENVNGETYEPELRDALRETLFEPHGQWCGTNPGKRLILEVKAWVEKHSVDVPWVWKETLSGANVNGHLGDFFWAIKQRDVVLVGPKHLRAMDSGVIDQRIHIQVPDGIAWQKVDALVEQIRAELRDRTLVLFASGMATNLMIHRLWPCDATLLDMGAMLDPYAGVFSRKGYRKEVFQERNMARNLG